MSDTIAGIVTLRHADGTITYGSALPMSSQGYSYTDGFQRDDITQAGALVSAAAHTKIEEVTIDVILLSAGSSFEPPDALDAVTLSAYQWAYLNGVWNYNGMTVTGKEGTKVMANLKLFRPKEGYLAID